jgi:hypothetical protein
MTDRYATARKKFARAVELGNPIIPSSPREADLIVRLAMEAKFRVRTTHPLGGLIHLEPLEPRPEPVWRPSL